MDLLVDKKRIHWDFGSISTVTAVLLVFSVEYYCFIMVFTNHLLEIQRSLGVFILIEIHLFIVVTLWSYFKVITSGPGYLSSRINEAFSNVEDLREKQKLILKYKKNKKKDEKREEDSDSHPNDIVYLGDENRKQNTEDLESDPENIRIKKIATNPILQLQETGYCFKCNRVKIPRAHHCKNCKRCVLRMDHHCPWTGNCIGLYNHKYFVLFLVYGAILCLQTFFWQAGIFLPDAYNFKQGLSSSEVFIIQVSLVIAAGLSISLCFLAIFQVHITCRNITTVEHHIEGIFEKNPFDKGSLYNIEEIFGVDRSTWFLPVKPKLKSEEDLFLLKNY